MIFQPKNTRGKIKKTNRFQSGNSYSEKDFKSKSKNISLTYFLYFMFLLLGVFIGYFFFIYYDTDKKIITNIFGYNNNEVSKFDKEIQQKEFQKKYLSEIEADINLIRRDYSQIINKRIGPIEEKIQGIERLLTEHIKEIENFSKIDEQKISNTLDAMNANLNKANKKIRNIDYLSKNIVNLEEKLNNEITYLSINIYAEKLRRAVNNKNDTIGIFEELKRQIYKININDYAEVLAELDSLLKSNIKTKADLFLMFNELEKSILKENKLFFQTKKSNKTIDYFSSLITIKSLKNQDIDKKNEDIFLVKKLFKENKISEAINKAKNLTTMENENLSNLVEYGERLLRFDDLMLLIENINPTIESSN